MCREVSSWSPADGPASYVLPSSRSCRSSSSFGSSSFEDWVSDVIRCLDPFMKGRIAYPCGRCDPCRLNRRRTWSHRLMLEAMCHEENAFVTLTYADEFLPADRSLHSEHTRGWLKRLRSRIAPRRFRYFVVGEYGDTSERPHYHAALFNFPSCVAGPVRNGACQCSACLVVRETWGLGHISLGSLEARSAYYICGYTTKKMTALSDVRLNGRSPEFARMSLKPGIGALAMSDVASVVMQYKLDQRQDFDVPVSLRHGSNQMPLGRYLRRRLRIECGLPEDAPDHVLEALASGLQPVWDAVEAAASNVPFEVRQAQARDLIGTLNKQGALNQMAKVKLKRRSL